MNTGMPPIREPITPSTSNQGAEVTKATKLLASLGGAIRFVSSGITSMGIGLKNLCLKIMTAASKLCSRQAEVPSEPSRPALSQTHTLTKTFSSETTNKTKAGEAVLQQVAQHEKIASSPPSPPQPTAVKEGKIPQKEMGASAEVLKEQKIDMHGMTLKDLAPFQNAQQKITDERSGLTFIRAVALPNVLVVEGFKDPNIISIGIGHGADGKVESVMVKVLNPDGNEVQIDLNGKLPGSIFDAFIRSMVKAKQQSTQPLQEMGPPVVTPTVVQHSAPSAVQPTAAQGPQISQATVPPALPTGVQQSTPSAVQSAPAQGPQPFPSVQTGVPPSVQGCFGQIKSSDLKNLSESGISAKPGQEVRSAFMQAAKSTQIGGTVVLAKSDLLSMERAQGLFTNQRPEALGTKFMPGSNITNMEAVLRTFTMALLPISIAGDYKYQNGHGITPFIGPNKQSQTRSVILSTMVQPDCESGSTVINACCLEQKEVRGTLTLPQEISSQAKQNDTTRSQYDHEIKSALVGNFVGAEGLKAESEIPPSQILTPRQATAKLEEILTSAKTPEQIENSLKDMYVKVSFQETDELAAQQGVQTKVLSGQMFFKMYVESLNAELSNLEAACPQGYVFTVDPPSIFASCFSDGPNQKNPTAMNRFQMLALKYLSLKQTSAGAPVPFPHMKSFGFNNFADPNAPALYASFLGERARTKASLFSSPSGQYTPPVGQESCALVIHNNSDGYGNNIENESGGGSMDAVIGQYSSAAATLAQAGLAPARPEIPPQPGRLASGLTLGSSVPKTPAPATPALAPKPSAVAEKVSTPTPQQITPSAVQPAAAQPLPQVLGEERKSMAGVMLRDLALFKNAKQKIADQESGLTFIQAATHPDVLVVEGFKDSNIISIGIRHGPDGSVASARATVRNQQGQREEIDLNGELPKSVHDAFFRAMVKQEGPQTFPSVAGRPLTPQEQAVAQQIAQVPEKTKLGASLAYTSGAEIESKGGILLTPTKNPAEFYEGIAVMPDPAGGYRLHLCPGGGYQEFDMQKINELMKQAVATAFQKGITITSYEGSVGRHSGATKANFQQWQKSPLQETPPPVTPTGAQQIPSSAVQPAGVQGPQIPQATMPPVIPAGAQYIQPSAVPPAAAQGPQIPQATMPPVIPTGVQYIMPSAVPPAGVQGPQPFSSVAGPLMSQEQAFTYQIAHAPMRRNPAVTVVLAKGADIINQGPDQLNGILLTVPPNNDLNVPYEGIAVVPDPDVAGGYRLHICLGAKPEFDRQKINELMMEAVATAAQQGVNITSFDPSMGRHGSRPTLENFMKWQADNWAVPS